jgi:hypothetical protein
MGVVIYRAVETLLRAVVVPGGGVGIAMRGEDSICGEHFSCIETVPSSQTAGDRVVYNPVYVIFTENARLALISPLQTDSLPPVSEIYWRQSADDAIMYAP